MASNELYLSFSQWCGGRCKSSWKWHLLIAYFTALWRISVPAKYPGMLNYLLNSVTFQKNRILNINTVEMSNLARITLFMKEMYWPWKGL